MEDLIESKLLDLNLDKCKYIVAGSKKGILKIKKNLEKKPLTLCSNAMKEVSVNKYL